MLCGGWAAFVCWAIVQLTLREKGLSQLTYASLTGALLGLLLAGTIGTLDAILNAVGFQRVVRVFICMIIGTLGGLLGGFIGELFHAKGLPVWIGWIIAGVFIGASIGIFDILRASSAGEDLRMPIKKTLNGIYGGCLGGFLGGLPFEALMYNTHLPRSNLTIGLVILGLCQGLLIGLAQVILKEAWVKVEQGFRAGREVMINKNELTVGKGESCDIGLFGDQGLEKLHARIIMKGNRYLLADNGTPGGTYLNDERIDGPTPLKNGDLIRLGRSLLRFGERAKRR